MGLDAISTPQLVHALPVDAVPAAINGREADASTAIEIIAAPGVGLAIFLLDLFMTCDDDDAAPHIQDEDDNILFGPVYAKAAGPIVVHKEWKEPHIGKVASNKAVELKAVAAGNISIWLVYAIGSG